MDEERYISVKESLIDACKEVHEMRAGKLPKPTMEDFWKEIDADIQAVKGTSYEADSNVAI
ncbi:MAG: hypothetical protein J6N99_08980 [Schwartzia sp.]|nr:hypothetical protein [Schwartzia sp. (in: firmicutes)]MBO6237108.1 hypothetical protein [Schwartzia sp. (in: firmicutes)]MBO6295412.1 hypothetical protein [Schwartzia sp. (in: firmicutes)]